MKRDTYTAECNVPPLAQAFQGCGTILNLEVFYDRLRTLDQTEEVRQNTDIWVVHCRVYPCVKLEV